MIVPSSNTVLEPELARLAPADVAVHVTRVRVTEIDLAPKALAQFDLGPMTAAASLLGDAQVDAVAWAGTAGSWLGLDHDRRLAGELSEAAGAPATTSTLALLDACAAQGISRIGLITPYVEPVVNRISATLAGAGIAVIAEQHLGITDNHAFASVGAETIHRMAGDCTVPGVQALVVLCTNLRADPIAGEIQHRTGLPVLDSIAVTLAGTRAIATWPAPMQAHSIGGA
jgi:maleate isomerase